MPGITGAKKLYLAKSVGELNQTAKKKVIGFKDVKRCCRSSGTAYQEAEKSYLDGDEEKAYLFYMVFLELYSIGKNAVNEVSTSKNLKEFTQSFENKKVLKALGRAEDLGSSLAKRYELLKDSTNADLAKETIQENSAETEPNKGDSNSGEDNTTFSENDTPEPAFKKDSISCCELYQLLSDSSITLVIFDARFENEFNSSHIKHDYCTNIPAEVLKPGITSTKIEKSLPPSVMNIWNNRDKVDFVILVDTSSSVSSLKFRSPLHSLREALCKWDLTTVLKSDPLILEGGFADWFLRYPTVTTGNQFVADVGNSSAEDPVNMEELANCDYPDLNEPIIKTPNEQTSDSDVVLNNGWTNNSKLVFTKPLIDRYTKPKPVLYKKDEEENITPKNHTKFPLDIVKKDNINIMKNPIKNDHPIIDRSSKPSHLVDHKPKIPNSAQNNSENVASKVNVELTDELNLLRLRSELKAEEDMRLALQEKEESLISKIETLEKDKYNKEVECLAIKEENDKMKKELNDYMHKQEKSSIVNLQIKDQEKIKLEKDLDRLRDEKKKIEKESKPKKEEVETGEKIQILKSDGPRVAKNDTKGSRSLSRSHSFPNIAQMVEEEENKMVKKRIPHFDRALKPSKNPDLYASMNRTFKLEELSTSRLKNLSPEYGNQQYAVTGLKNLGNTCFMNSIIQCLSNTTPLTSYFISGNYRNSINRKSKQGTGGEVAEEFAVVIRALWNGHYRSISPRDFKNTVSRYLSVCVGHDQQDSHEFLIILMEKLHGDFNQHENRTNSQPKLENIPDHKAEEMFWNHHISLNESIIVEFFEGLLRSTLRCLHCNTTSSNYEVFSCLSLPIPSNRCSLKDCLSLFLKEERMAGEGAWDCPHCKQKQEAEKKMVICRLPKVLIIQLKRFSYEGLWRRKLQTHVDFPISDMDLSQVPNQKSVYHLYGVVNHFGTLEGGHYTAFCKNSIHDKWYKYDDQDVAGPINQKDVNTSAAYILFYSCLDFHLFL